MRKAKLMWDADRDYLTKTVKVRPSVFVEPASVGCPMDRTYFDHGSLTCDRCGVAVVDHHMSEPDVDKAADAFYTALAVFECAMMNDMFRRYAEEGVKCEEVEV